MIGHRWYIDEAGIVSAQRAYEWDEWNIKEYYRYLDEDWFDRLDALTGKANLGLTIAAAEWLIHRFSSSDPDPEPGLYLEAAWAGAVHSAYCPYMETGDDPWRGPVRGPMSMAMTIVNDALYGLEHNPNISVRACWLYNLTRHVLPDTKAFDAWWESCVQRLERFHSIAIELADYEPDLFENFPNMGSPVPPEAFDPRRPYDPAQNPSLWDAYLRSLDPSANPFLSPPEELAEHDDLPGPPYRYIANP
ncbi:hypothetical protein [Pseudomonas indica]|uniref:hypothetical protein n=1 Tax=Pseudomonas indica TaxID=137658 RepID=UPI0023F73C1C|nr:hypothetical protein [Pseudomonas indica]MBU3059269.1 hypothetical protein [Pseudomonas indica]